MSLVFFLLLLAAVATPTFQFSSPVPPSPLPPTLESMVASFSQLPSEKLRYKQLLYLAQTLPPAPPDLCVPENKVPGCLSTVFVSAETDLDGKITFYGESDGLLTKGLVNLLVSGLSGSTIAEIEAVDSSFITRSGIDQSLTPGRNNGFLNMLGLMKVKARQAGEAEKEQSSPTLSSTASSATPIYDTMLAKLAMLQPTTLVLEDVSHEHAGHSGAKGLSGESHFDLDITANCFDGLASVKRHQLVYTILGDTMQEIHALQIKASTPE